MNRSPLVLFPAAAVCFTFAACFSTPHSQPQTKPTALSENLRLPLVSGGEVQIIAVTYGTEHRLKPNAASRNALARAIARAPHDYARNTTLPSVVIWWGWRPAGSSEFMLSPSGNATLLLPGGQTRLLEYPDPAGEVRSLAIAQPPTSLPALQIRLRVNGEAIPLSIPNPAYSASKP